MTVLPDPILFACWAVFAVFWFVAALFAKRTAERGRSGWLRIAVILAIAAAILPARLAGRRSAEPLWAATPAVHFAGDGLAVAGLAISLWARITLGANWSGWVALKENHELVERGPYRFARHPIYSGILLMLLGTVIVLGTPVALAAFAASVLGLAFKARQEEHLLAAHFPDSYPRYRRRVKAFFPFLL